MATRKTKEEREAERLAKENAKKLQQDADILAKLREESLKIQKEDNLTLEEKIENLREIRRLEKEELDLRKKIQILRQQDNKLYDSVTDKQEDLIEDLDNQIAQSKTINKELEQQEKIIERQKQLNKDIGDALQNQITQLFGIDGNASTIAGKFLKSKLEIIDMQNGLKEASFSTKLLVSAVDSLVQNTVELAKEQETVFTQLNKDIGAYKKYESTIIDVSRANVEFGISTKDGAIATEALFKNINTFNILSKNTTKELIDTTAKLEKLGINSDVTAKNIMTLTKATGMSLEAARKLQIQFAALADDIGLPPKELAEEFSNAAPKLAMYGADMTKVFVGLAKASKETGLSINTLVGITGKFDTFEGAADAAGKLNAILGGDLLNSTELMLASDEERVKMLQDSIAMSGKNWESLNRFEKMAIAAAAGISDMDEATKIFNPSQNKMTVGLREAQDAAKKLQERAEDVQEVSVRWDNVMKSLALTMRPFILVLEKVVGGLASLIDSLNELGGANTVAIIASVGILIASFIKMGNVLASLIKIKQAYSAASGTSAKIMALFGKEIEQTAGAAQKSGQAFNYTALGIKGMKEEAAAAAKKMLSFGAAVLMIGFGIGAAAAGVGYLASAFSKLDKDQIDGATTAIIAVSAAMILLVGGMLALAAFAPQAAISTAILWGIAGAMLAFGAGVALAATGIGYAISSVTNAKTELVKAMKELPSTFSALEDSVKRLADFDFSGLAENMATPFTQTVEAIKQATGEITKFKSEYASLAPSPTTPNAAAMANAMSSTSQTAVINKTIEIAAKNQTPVINNQAQDSKPVTLILKIDSREFAEATWQAYRDVTELKMKAR